MSPGPQACTQVSKIFDQASTDARSKAFHLPPDPIPRSSVDVFLISFGIIFGAELGDKSQLIAMTFAARYRATTILIAITAATALVHLVSVLLGAAVGVAMPTKAISVVAGLAFLGFAAWTLRGDKLDEDEAARAAQTTKSVFFTIAIAFFLAELGDKTMLATVTLATDNGLIGTWIGSTMGMVAAQPSRSSLASSSARGFPNARSRSERRSPSSCSASC